MAAPIHKLERDDTVNSLVDGPVWKRHHASSIYPSHFCSSCWPENTVHEQIRSILVLAKNGAVQVFCDIRRATEYSLIFNVVWAIQSIVDRSALRYSRALTSK